MAPFFVTEAYCVSAFAYGSGSDAKSCLRYSKGAHVAPFFVTEAYCVSVFAYGSGSDAKSCLRYSKGGVP